MTLPNTIPHFLRLKDLQERNIVTTHQGVRNLQKRQGFPKGRLLGPGTRVWSIEEITDWLATRPIEPSDLTKARAQKSIDARRRVSA
jgi:hypothetical protein